MRRTLAAIVLMASGWACAAPTDARSFIGPDERLHDYAAFCRIVADHYAYFRASAADWTRECEELLGEARDAADRDAYIGVLERSLGHLHDAHAHLAVNTRHSPRLVPSQADVMASWEGARAMVTDVRRGSRADDAGLRDGDEVITIDGRTTGEAVSEYLPGRRADDADRATREWALAVALAGRHDTSPILLGIRNASGERQVSYVPAFPAPKSRLRAATHGRIGVVRLNNSLGDESLVHDFDEVLDGMLRLDALVLDLRDTPSGGTSSVARGLLSRLVDAERPYQRHELIGEYTRTGVRRVWVEHVLPRGRAFRGPVVVLVGRWTGSMGEGLAIGAEAATGALVLGRPMAHLLGALDEFTLPDSGIVVRIPTERLFHVDGRPRESFLPCPVTTPAGAGRGAGDPELQAALDLLEKQVQKGSMSRLECDAASKRR